MDVFSNNITKACSATAVGFHKQRNLSSTFVFEKIYCTVFCSRSFVRVCTVHPPPRRPTE